MSTKIDKSPISAKLRFKGNRVEHWKCDSPEQLSSAIIENYQSTGLFPKVVTVDSSTVKVGGAVLSEKTLQRIASYQDENDEGLQSEIASLTELLIEIIHLEFGDERNKLFMMIVADQIDFLNSLKTA